MTEAVSIAYVIDPRFPGGTSSAIARELPHVAAAGRLKLYALETSMFDGKDIAPQLADALDDLRLDPIWNPGRIEADLVIFHNPSCLKFQETFWPQILCRHLVVVTHENFLRPGGVEGFDVARCLDLIDRGTLALRKSLAPVSPHNRDTVRRWCAGAGSDWALLERDWINICDFELSPPTDRPRDRRGRHSRPGFEKFPSLAALDLCFPPHAETNLILGADTLVGDGPARPHWTLVPFRGMAVEAYLERIDFMVYFTAPTWRESFGRVLAEAVAAGKVVLSDAETGATFGTGVVAATPETVDATIQGFIADPARYRAQVEAAQARLTEAFSPETFRAALAEALDPARNAPASRRAG